MAQLKELDKVAYLRFASVYLSFEDISEFADEIARLGKESLSRGNITRRKNTDKKEIKNTGQRK